MWQHHLITVRRSIERDTEGIARVIVAAAGKAYAYFNWNESLKDIRDWLEANPEGWTEMWVGEIAGNVAGFMAMNDDFIDQLFVFPQWQKMSLGSRLMNQAKQLYPRGLTLHCSQQNWPACAFYERHGFIAVVHRIHQPHGIGEIVYRCHGG